jgi:tetratricopeptide (TPR) repeat protein
VPAPPEPIPSAAPDVRHQTASVADPAVTTDGDATRSPPPPPTSGDRYTLGDEIARGGMGVVYRATDTVLNREVAVKVLKDKFTPESGTCRRFADEARITAQLQHPNIPAVHDLSALPDGRPFLAMKLIKGETLDLLLAARPDPSADHGRFVAVFEQVCQAVAYAHAHGVLHRDLKPANVMVGAFGEVQVMDWGLAKVLTGRERDHTESDPESTAAWTEVRPLRDSEDLLTQAGSVLGTPGYMPPEQALGAVHEVDRRSDVFGLGGILAAVLTGRPPFVGDSAEVTRVMAARGEIQGCIGRLDSCAADPELVALCKRCLSPRPEGRPADAGTVAQAVAELRQAADERARRAEVDKVRAEGDKAAAELAARERRRRRRVSLGAAAALALAVIGGMGAVLGVQRRSNADLAAKNDELERKNAEVVAASEREREKFDLAMEAIRSFHTGAGEEVVLGRPELKRLRTKLLGGADEFYRKLEDRLGPAADPKSRVALAKGYIDLGVASSSVGSLDQALADYDRGRVVLEAVLSDAPGDTAARRELSRAFGQRAQVFQKRKDPAAQREAGLRAAAEAERAVADGPDDPENRNALADAITFLSSHDPLPPTDAERRTKRAVELAERLVADHPGNVRYQATLAGALHNLGADVMNQSRFEEALGIFARRAEIGEALRRADPANTSNRRNLMVVYSFCRGEIFRRLGRAEESLAEHRKAVAVGEELAADQPAVIDTESRLASCLGNVGYQLYQLGHREEAADAYLRVVAIRDRLADHYPDQPDLRWSAAGERSNLATVLDQLGRFDEAMAARREGVGQLETLSSRYPADWKYGNYLGRAQRDLARNLEVTGRGDPVPSYDAALKTYRRLVDSDPKAQVPRSGLADTLNSYGIFLTKAGRTAEGVKLQAEAVAVAERLVADFPAEKELQSALVAILNEVAIGLRNAGDEPASLAAAERAAAIAEKLVAGAPRVLRYRTEMSLSLTLIGLNHLRAGRQDEARKALERCLTMRQQLAAETPKDRWNRNELARAHTNLASLDERAGKLAAAAAAYETALALREAVVREDPHTVEYRSGLASSLVETGRMLRRAGQLPDAASRLERAVTVANDIPTNHRSSSAIALILMQSPLELAMVRLAEGKPAKAADLLAKAVAGHREDATLEELSTLAALHAQLARSAAASPDGKVGGGTAAEHADRAMAALRRAVDKGYGDVLRLKASDAYDPLRDRDDFKTLVAALEAKTPKPRDVSPPRPKAPPRS